MGNGILEMWEWDTYLEVEVTSRRATPRGVSGPENTNLRTSFPIAVSRFYI